MGLFCLSAPHFHTVFNKTVENFHGLFTIPGAIEGGVARELLWPFQGGCQTECIPSSSAGSHWETAQFSRCRRDLQA
jgi:hypothetical protein